jgi:ABC-type phosphate transport system substrate-binding protein
MRQPRVLLGFLFAIAALAAAEGERSYRIVVNRDNALTSMSRKEVSAIFLRRRTEWPDGTTAWPVDQLESAQVREDFTRAVHGRTVSAVKTYWLQIVFSGRGVPPLERATDHEVVDYVKSHPGAVGYVTAAARTGEVHVLTVDP